MSESEQVRVRSYLDALSDYEKVNKEAISAAHHALMRGSAQHVARVRSSTDASRHWPEDDPVRDVMIRWHNALIQVLWAWEQVPHHQRDEVENPPSQLSVA